ncbi:6705_t:CDS:2 [Entrophospora sp. SA101]|nr:15751_t:CDS:2 [Entrophospora sp. SA101]CAJ0843217.1 9149_t:CDS:2 [Entrophospora sp. SA101]CAJ0852923.1 6705_t:CDS:2 [Entrophospora sp. SA101]
MISKHESDIVKVSILNEESIIIGFHLTELIFQDIIKSIPSSTYVIITDKNIASIYLSDLITNFENIVNKLFSSSPSSPRILTYVIPPGEQSKSRKTKGEIEDYLLSKACTRDACIIALGGGVVGDLVGYVAATFMRGVPFVQVPTTLLAMVDSSIGGKTAIDTPHGKNLIGAFWQPKKIFVDLNFLTTLPEREFINGMAEVIKHAAIWNNNEFEKLENGVKSIHEAVLNPPKDVPFQGNTLETRTPSQSLLLSVILASIKVKAHVVTHDERESGLRGLLNFGHTIGHAIETILAPDLLHGECVSIGMIKEAEISRNLGYLNQVAVGRLSICLQNYGLPVSLDDKKVKQLVGNKYCDVDRLLEIMKIDKKNQGDKKRLVILTAIGKTLEKKATVVSDSIIHKILSPAIRVFPKFSTNNCANSPTSIHITTPGSKSISNRALILAALGEGTCRLRGILYSDDTQVMLSGLRALGGAKFEWEDDGNTLVVIGGGGKLTVPDDEIYLGNAGTASRFLTTVCTLASDQSVTEKKQKTILTGNSRMKQRPIGPLVDALRNNGSQIDYLESEGCLPIAIMPLKKKLCGGGIDLAASISSQYVSSILMSAPYASEPVTLRLTGGQVISQPYIDMTISMMESFGVKVERLDCDMYKIPKASYKNPAEYIIESDASSATYPLAIAAVTGTKCNLPNIGSSSLQGDAAFAVKVLGQMGCEVTQTETSTTVQGPPIGSLKPLPTIDMETMTDAFLTASIVASVACNSNNNHENKNITRIIGIANQRVKECDRIAAMVHELRKFGVDASELSDGIQIHGAKIESLKGPVEGVKCYDDHRVAMSFSVLGCVVPNGTLIREKKCVEKTWPNWWDDLESKLGVKLVGVDLGPKQDDNKTTTATTTANEKNKSIILIGMRGVGKTTMGQFAAKMLNYKFLDVDQYFESKLGLTISELVEKEGWDVFRDKEQEIFKALLKDYATGYVISCGGGIVVHIFRDIQEVIKYLNKDEARPQYGEEIIEVWKRRKNWYKECSNYEFHSLKYNDDNCAADKELDRSELVKAKVDFTRFLKFITGQDTNQVDLEKTKRTFFVSLTYPDLQPKLQYISTIIHGVDAIELRVDLLDENSNNNNDSSNSNKFSIDYISKQLALLKGYSKLPIIFTLRTQRQGGKFFSGDELKIYDILESGLRWGCEYLDLEIGLSHNLITKLLKRKGNTKIIASWHDTTGNMKWDGEEICGYYRKANEHGDIIKLIGKARSIKDNFDLQSFLESVSSTSSTTKKKHIIAINMGSEGQLSRILNQTFTPVTHDLLPSKAAPGQLSIKQIHQGLNLIGLLPKKKFYLFGAPISHSLSPTIHNTGFETLGFPYHYELFESEDVKDVKPIIFESEEFGGGSVTIPHKTSDNTDWLGILNSIKLYIDTPINNNRNISGLVVGAGGTSRAAIYALHKLGATKIYLYNRTPEKVKELIKQFPTNFGLHQLNSLTASSLPSPSPKIIISTIPGTTNFEYPDEIFKFHDDNGKGVIVEMAYKPHKTNLIIKGEKYGWNCVEGIQVLIEQGLYQFERWTGRKAPKDQIMKTVMEKYYL